MHRPFILFEMNLKQAKCLLVSANENWILGGRGSGKTQGGTAPFIINKVRTMPRSSGGIVVQSFADGEEKILRPLFMGFAMMGMELGVHYVYGTPPPDNWEKPLTAILNFKYCISFSNGTTCELISLHQKGSANSYSFQWIVGPEAKFFDPEQLRTEVFPILRGHVRHFGMKSGYGAKFFETDKYSPDINWILEKRKLQNEKLIQTIIFWQLQINEKRAKMDGASDSAKAKLLQDINNIHSFLEPLRKKAVFVGEWSAYDNLKNLSADFIESRRSDLTEYEFEIAIENLDPKRAENGFYPSRTDKHLYDIERDEDTTMPIAVALDYQGSISPLVAAQVNDLVVPGTYTLNFLRSMYVKRPLKIRQVVQAFCEFYLTRPCKVVYYFYDHTAVGENGLHDKIYEDVTKYFEDEGWTVVQVAMGQAPKHNVKFLKLNEMLDEQNERYYPMRMHKHNTTDMVLSMDLAEAKEVPGEGTKKDKSKERDAKYPQEMATHFSDTFDMLAWGINELKLMPAGARDYGGVEIG